MWLQTLCVYALWPSGFGFADTVIIIIIKHYSKHRDILVQLMLHLVFMWQTCNFVTLLLLLFYTCHMPDLPPLVAVLKEVVHAYCRLPSLPMLLLGPDSARLERDTSC